MILGRPPPRMTWWDGSEMLQTTEKRNREGILRSEVIIPNLGRKHVGMTLTCQVSNYNDSLPLQARLKLILNRK